MIKLMTKEFSKWAKKQKLNNIELFSALEELRSDNFDANLGSNLYKKRIKFKGQGKSGSGRTIICYKKEDRAIYVHGFNKNEKASLSKKELIAFKEFSKILLAFSMNQLNIAIENGDLIEVTL